MISLILLSFVIINVLCQFTSIKIDQILSINETTEFLTELFRIEQTNISQLLIENEPILIWYRNMIFKGAQINQINYNSSNEQKLFYVKKLIKWIYLTIDPKDEYTAV